MDAVAARKLCVYHAHPGQLYQDLSELCQRHARFKAATTLATLKLSSQEKLLCDYVMERCIGQIISLRAIAPVDDTEAAVVPYKYDSGGLVDAACQAALALSQDAPEKIDRQHGPHRFYQVLKGDLHRRFLMVATETRQWQLAVLRLDLCGKAGAAGVFTSTGQITHLDIHECLSTQRVEDFLASLYVWKSTQSSWLRILDVHASTSSTALRSLSSGGYGRSQLTVYKGRSANALLESIVERMLGAEKDSFWYDAPSGRIMGDNGSFSVDVPLATFQMLEDSGVLRRYTSEMGDYEYKVNARAIQFMETLDLHSGCRNPTAFLRQGGSSRLRVATKLSLIMLLRSEGWTPSTGVDIHTPASTKTYRHLLSKSRWYFIALAEVTEK